MTIDFSIRPELSGDVDAICDVHRNAFGPDEPIAVLVERLRRLDAPLATLSFVACDPSDTVIGHVMMSHGWLDAPERLIDVLVLSPLGVTPAAQRQGVGTALIERAIDEAGRTVAPILILEGNPAFYGPRGFEASKPLGIRSPSLRIPERALQVVRLPSYDQAVTGSLVYRELWWELDCVGLR